MAGAGRGAGIEADVGVGPPGAVRRADGLTFDPRAAVAHVAAVDARLAELVALAGPFTVRPDHDLDTFHYLVRSIVFQQLNGTAAASIHGRLLGLWGGRPPTAAQLLSVDVAALREVGISGNKAASLHDLARHVLDGTVPDGAEAHGLDDASLVRRLTAVRGIGPWTVHMLLMFRLGRPDVLPTGDFGVREGHRLLHGSERQPTPTQLRADAERWRPYRSVGSWYMWRAVDLVRSGELGAPAAAR